MNEKTGFILFLSMFLLVFGSMHLYVFGKFSSIFNIERNLVYYIIIVILVSSYILSTLLYSRKNNFLTQYLYIFSAVWFGLILLLFFLILLLDMIALLSPINIIVSAYIVLFITIVLSVYAVWNASSMVTKVISLESEKINTRIVFVQVSDVHLGAIYGINKIKKIVSKINAINPAAVFITGDLIDGKNKHDASQFLIFNKIRCNTFFVIGNHERYAGIEFMNELFKNVNITILKNNIASLGKKSNIKIIGIDDSDDRKQVANYIARLSINKSTYNILLYHRPDGFHDAVNHNVDLMLAGHTHAGQIFPYSLLARFFYSHYYGLKQYKNAYLYVSSGAGTWGPPFRLGSRTEIVKIVINPKTMKNN